MNHDPFAKFKESQREGWAFFAPLEVITIQPAGHLVEFSGVAPGQRVLDVGCGTGVAAITAALRGAEVEGLDLCPTLLERAIQNSQIAGVEISFREGDVESLPYDDAEFDCVLSQFGHMFAPQPTLAVREMLRVLKPGGTIAFSTWPPELFTGQMFGLVGKYLPPPDGAAPPPLWGDPQIIRERLGDQVTELRFSREVLHCPALSIEHLVAKFESTAGPIIKLKQKLSVEDPAALNRFREELKSLTSGYVRLNTLHQHFLMTRAVRR